MRSHSVFSLGFLTKSLLNGILFMVVQLTEVEYHMEYDPWKADRLGKSPGRVGFFAFPA